MCSSLSIFSWLLALGLVFGVTTPAVAAPNLIVILADDLGYGDVSPYGGWVETPHLQRLADEGVRFTDFHSSGNVCSPTRAGLLTGRYQQRAGVSGVIYADASRPVHQQGVQDVEWTLAEALRVADYRTGVFGKWHLGYFDQYNPTRHGFDVFRGYVSGNVDYFSHFDQSGRHDWRRDLESQVEQGYTTTLITEHACEFIAADDERPFFAYIAHEAPHYPYQGPDDRAHRGEGVGRAADRDHELTRDQIRERYRAMTQALDDSVGAVLDLLDERGLADNTLIFLLSDNGAVGRYGDNGPLRGAKGSNWEGGHRVPAICRWPARIPAGVSDELTISLDVMPTLLNCGQALQAIPHVRSTALTCCRCSRKKPRSAIAASSGTARHCATEIGS